MAFLTHDQRRSKPLAHPRIDPAWVLLALTVLVLLAAAIWSDHVADRSLEDWHGNVKVHGPAERY